jgi:hypothetical protein
VYRNLFKKAYNVVQKSQIKLEVRDFVLHLAPCDCEQQAETPIISLKPLTLPKTPTLNPKSQNVHR